MNDKKGSTTYAGKLGYSQMLWMDDFRSGGDLFFLDSVDEPEAFEYIQNEQMAVLPILSLENSKGVYPHSTP